MDKVKKINEELKKKSLNENRSEKARKVRISYGNSTITSDITRSIFPFSIYFPVGSPGVLSERKCSAGVKAEIR